MAAHNIYLEHGDQPVVWDVELRPDRPFAVVSVSHPRAGSIGAEMNGDDLRKFAHLLLQRATEIETRVHETEEGC